MTRESLTEEAARMRERQRTITWLRGLETQLRRAIVCEDDKELRLTLRARVGLYDGIANDLRDGAHERGK